MRSEFRCRRSIVAVAAILVTLCGSAGIAFGQSAETYKAPRTPDGQPNFSGMWQAMNSANWDLEEHGAQPAPFQNFVGVYLAQPAGLSVVEGGTIPYKPEALARKQRNLQNRLAPDPAKANSDEPVGDPEAKCFGAVAPRAAYMPFAFQIVQSKDAVLMAYEYAATPRVVHLAAVDPTVFYGVDTWSGQSKGRWEGETLVVETQGFSGEPWLDRAGNFMSQKAKVVERYTATSPYHLMYEATITDPTVFTRPWTIRMPLYKRIEPNTELLEFQCVSLSEEFLYGKLKKASSTK